MSRGSTDHGHPPRTARTGAARRESTAAHRRPGRWPPAALEPAPTWNDLDATPEWSRAVIEAADRAALGLSISTFNEAGGALAFVNATGASLLGRTREELIPGPAFPPMTPKVEETLRGHAGRFTLKLPTPRGEMALEFGLSEGTYWGRPAVFAFFQDVGERLRLEAARRTAERERRLGIEREAEVERLRKADRFRQDLVNAAAHDLFTPMTPVLLQLAILEGSKYGPLTPQQARALGIIHRNVEGVARLVRDLAQMGKLDAETAADDGSTDLEPLFEDARMAFGDAAQEKGVRLEIARPNGLRVRGPPDRIRQALWHLLDNALKFTPTGGSVEARAQLAEAGVAVVVRDSGVGFTPDQQAELFEPFRHPHAEVAPQAKGSGLGLYVSRRIAQRYGGSLAATSEGTDKGSTFTLQLPLAPVPPEPAAPSDATPSAPTGPPGPPTRQPASKRH